LSDVARSWATRPQGSSRVPRCAVEGGSARLVACRIGEARRAARLFTRNRAHRHVGWPPKGRLVNHDERRPYRQASRDPVSDFWFHIDHRSRTQFSALGSHCRIPGVCSRRAKTPTAIRPLPPAGAYRFAPDPISKKKQEKNPKSDFSNFSVSRFFSIASTLRGQSSALASNDHVQSYSQIVVFV